MLHKLHEMKLKFIVCLLLVSPALLSQVPAQFTVHISEECINAPVSIESERINFSTDKGNLVLYEIINDREVLLPVQPEPGHTGRLWFILTGISEKNSKREFVIKQATTGTDIPGNKNTELIKQHRDLHITANKKPVLSYRFATTYPPEGIDPLYKRSGYIHPLWSPAGEVLSRIQPPDHYHHYGIWGPWTLTRINDREVDFWNLAKGEGTVRFKAFLTETEGEVFSGFKALQQHIDFGAAGADQVAINELLDVRTWNTGDSIWMIDYTTSLNSPLPTGILLDAYRYGGGIGFRATEKWHKDNCTVLTSEGKTRIDADGSNARWCIVEGESNTAAGRSGILFLSHPSNRMHPEPMRVWPLDANGGRGDMYFEFVPIRHQSWKLESRQDYTLKYRMILFDGVMKTKTAEMYWNAFAKMPEVTVLK